MIMLIIVFIHWHLQWEVFERSVQVQESLRGRIHVWPMYPHTLSAPLSLLHTYLNMLTSLPPPLQLSTAPHPFIPHYLLLFHHSSLHLPYTPLCTPTFFPSLLSHSMTSNLVLSVLHFRWDIVGVTLGLWTLENEFRHIILLLFVFWITPGNA